MNALHPDPEEVGKMKNGMRENAQTHPVRIIPLVRWNEYHPWPPVGGLRHLVFHSKTNGFEKVIKRCGRRILIDEAKFFEFVETKNGEKSIGAGSND